jgi:hypothetical protein
LKPQVSVFNPVLTRPIVDATGLPITKPWPLRNGIEKRSQNTTPDMLDFKPYTELDWSPLLLV